MDVDVSIDINSATSARSKEPRLPLSGFSLEPSNHVAYPQTSCPSYLQKLTGILVGDLFGASPTCALTLRRPTTVAVVAFRRALRR